MQWHDGTVAFVNYVPSPGANCFWVLGLHPSHLTLQKMTCNKPQLHYYLCEFAVREEKQTFHLNSQTLLPHTPITNATALPSTHIQCPEGHVTYTLFACDAQTSCWMERPHVQVDLSGRPATESCPAPMTPLPPYFSCQTSWRVAAYTVVCDHRRDCPDGSDEDFCVFPACSPDTDITCNNGQVSLGKVYRADR